MLPISRHLVKIFRHYKGGYYIKIYNATNENNENAIVYRCLQTDRIFTTTEKRWEELVFLQTEKTPPVERFTPVETPELMNQQFEMYHRARCLEEKERREKEVAFFSDIFLGVLSVACGGAIIYMGYQMSS